MEKNNNKTYWPHMILGFLIIGLTLGYWTVKSASSIPVQEVNKYMMKYQQADLGINEIIEKKKAFDKVYNIALKNVKMMVMTDNVNSNLPQPNVIQLTKGENKFLYVVTKKDGTVVNDANVSFLLTRPHTVKDDVMVEHIAFDNGGYRTPVLDIEKPGRYTLQCRVKINDNQIGYSELPAYLKP